MKILLLASMALALLAGAARAAENAPAQNLCELTCQYKGGSGARRIVSCYERTDEKQCAAIADHKNLNDAYPAKMSCAARIVPACTEAREF